MAPKGAKKKTDPAKEEAAKAKAEAARTRADAKLVRDGLVKKKADAKKQAEDLIAKQAETQRDYWRSWKPAPATPSSKPNVLSPTDTEDLRSPAEPSLALSVHSSASEDKMPLNKRLGQSLSDLQIEAENLIGSQEEAGEATEPVTPATAPPKPPATTPDNAPKFVKPKAKFLPKPAKAPEKEAPAENEHQDAQKKVAPVQEAPKEEGTEQKEPEKEAPDEEKATEAPEEAPKAKAPEEARQEAPKEEAPKEEAPKEEAHKENFAPPGGSGAASSAGAVFDKEMEQYMAIEEVTAKILDIFAGEKEDADLEADMANTLTQSMLEGSEEEKKKNKEQHFPPRSQRRDRENYD